MACQRCAACRLMPMACRTSAFRRPSAASALRETANREDAFAGPRVRISVKNVMATSNSPPISAVTPIQK